MKFRRKIYWAWPAHLAEGRMLVLERRPWCRGMVRVRVEPVPRRRVRRAGA